MMKICLKIAGIFLLSANAFANLQTGIENHSAGDIIAVRTDTDIAAWCDFTKQIILVQPNTLCVYNGKK